MLNMNIPEIRGLEPVYREYPHLTKKWYECPIERADVAFRISTLGRVPDPIKKLILDNALKLETTREQNLYILRATDKIVSLLPEKLQSSLMVEDAEIREFAENCADRCRRIACRSSVNAIQKPLTEEGAFRRNVSI
jgi:hypothetical protein